MEKKEKIQSRRGVLEGSTLSGSATLLGVCLGLPGEYVFASICVGLGAAPA